MKISLSIHPSAIDPVADPNPPNSKLEDPLFSWLLNHPIQIPTSKAPDPLTRDRRSRPNVAAYQPLFTATSRTWRNLSLLQAAVARLVSNLQQVPRPESSLRLVSIPSHPTNPLTLTSPTHKQAGRQASRYLTLPSCNADKTSHMSPEQQLRTNNGNGVGGPAGGCATLHCNSAMRWQPLLLFAHTHCISPESHRLDQTRSCLANERLLYARYG